MSAEDNDKLGIIRTAYVIEETARSLYDAFSRKTLDPGFRSFWHALSEEESDHLDFWRNLAEMSKTLPFDMIIDDPESLLETLSRNAAIASDMLEKVEGSDEFQFSRSDFLLMAYRLEFYMLDHSFQTLFQSLRFLQSDFDPVREYDNHIHSFIGGMKEFGKGYSEIELLAETLDRLWNENKRLNRIALEDNLTGALNRRGFMIMSTQVCSLMRRNSSSVGLIMLDLDDFKQLNDTRGHYVGDMALVQTVRMLKSNLRESDVIGRFGGDEFVVLLPDTLNAEEAAAKAVAALNGTLGESFGISVTAGHAQSLIECDSVTACIDRLIMDADRLLCSRKASRR